MATPIVEYNVSTAGSGSRSLAMKEPKLILYLAAECHRRIQGMPYAKQLIIGLLSGMRAANRVRSCVVVTPEKLKLYLNELSEASQ